MQFILLWITLPLPRLLPTGDVEGAARLADAARRMDLADRYLNCNAVKALFRAGHVSTAMRCVLDCCGAPAILDS